MKFPTRSWLLALLVIPSIRVAVIKEAPTVTIEGEKLWVKMTELKPVSYPLESPVVIAPTENGFKIGENFYSSPSVQIGSRGEALTVEGKTFKGKLEIRRTSNGGLLVLNEIPLEDYLVGLVHGEISASWPQETIKAQVVAARTYALFRQKQRQTNAANYDLESDTADQVYSGSLGESQDKIVKEAISATQGEVLWYLGLFPAYFHSCCGGQTETAERVWGKKEASTSVIDSHCERSPYREWELQLTQREFLDALKSHGLSGSHIKAITLERYETSPRNAMVIVETSEMTLFLNATDLRRILGYKEMKSTWFDVDWNARHVIFKGTGYGHGVGLCQWGAKAMAESEADYKTILEFYYPKAVVRKVY